MLRVLALDHVLRRTRALATVSATCQELLAILKVEVESSEQGSNKSKDRKKPALIVSNHISYLDAIVIFATHPATFVTSQEIAETPVLGLLTRLAGCIYVERRWRMRTITDVATIASALNHNQSVVLFPEGSTSQGFSLLKVKSSLLQALWHSRAKLTVVNLRYTRINGEMYSKSNADLVAWYGPMRFAPHLWSLLKCSTITVELKVSYPKAPRQHRCRKQLARDLTWAWQEELTNHS